MPNKYRVSVSWTVAYDIEVLADSAKQAQESVYGMGIKRIQDLAELQNGVIGYIDDSMFIDHIEKVKAVEV